MDNSVRNLMFDLTSGKELFDTEQNRVITKAEANDAIRKVMYEQLGLSKNSTEKQINRALKKDAAIELFEVIEELANMIVVKGWEENEFFNSFVDTRNIADGDRTDFVAKEDIILNVVRSAGDNHDLSTQRLNLGETYTVPTSVYVIKVGGAIREFVTGRKDWNEFVDAVAKAYTNKMQELIYTEFMNAAAQLPSTAQFTHTAALSAATKDTFDQMISDVATVNNSDVIIMGTKTALKKINALAVGNSSSVDWIADSQKEAVAKTGILGDYEGVTMLEIPQRFANQKVNDKFVELVDSNKLLIFPVVDYKPIKFVDGGEMELLINEVGATRDDEQTLEVQRRMGVATVITRYFGQWSFQ